MRVSLLALALLLGCGNATPAAEATDAASEIGTDVAADVAEAAVDAWVDKAATCVGTFGTALGSVGFARFDGTVVAVVPPAHPTCPYPNKTHVAVQIRVGEVIYRMVVNVQSDRSGIDPRIKLATLEAELPAPAWSNGIHEDAPLDYVTTLGLHAPAFAPKTMAEASAAVDAFLPLGAKVSVYASAGGKPESAHLVHRNATGQDGAIVVVGDATARFLLFSFDGQTF
ncbi:MAG: hypothetical protein IPJ34_15955 [Myxococcales bacterium]|nr:hypothetical protein [Myxococcales bacterium]